MELREGCIAWFEASLLFGALVIIVHFVYFFKFMLFGLFICCENSLPMHAEADMRREMERREQERKRSPKIEFFSGGTQIGTVPTPKINLPIPGLEASFLNTCIFFYIFGYYTCIGLFIEEGVFRII